MSNLGAIAADIMGLASGLRHTKDMLSISGDMIAKEMKDNIDWRQNAGEFRSVTTSNDGGPMSEMWTLSDLTLEERKKQGIDSDQPLKATGEMYRAIGIISRSDRQVKVGVKGRKNRMKQWRTLGTATTGELSTMLDHEIPDRNPWGYSEQVLEKLLSMWYNRLSVEGDKRVRAEVRINL